MPLAASVRTFLLTSRGPSCPRRHAATPELHFKKYSSATTKSSAKPARQYKRPSHPTSVPLGRLFSSQFPLSIKELLADYSYRKNPTKFQHDLLATLPFYPESDSAGRIGRVVRTALPGGNSINEFVIAPTLAAQDPAHPSYTSANHLIMVHGYGAGLGFYLKNFDALASRKNWVVHAIDLLGYGCSSRPRFTANNLEQVEAFFHDSFETWLKARNLTNPAKNLMLAHSMGAYLMATYALKRNDFAKILMVSPGAVIKHRTPVNVPSYFAELWNKNISPFSLVRNAGPLGSKLVSMWSSRRFANLPAHEAALLHKYSYGIFQSPGSGEYMLNYLLAPGADARHPLASRGIENMKCDMSWWYGLEDWMDPRGGELCSRLINANGGNSSVKIVANAGHHIYLDNPHVFNNLVLSEMDKMAENR